MYTFSFVLAGPSLETSNSWGHRYQKWSIFTRTSCKIRFNACKKAADSEVRPLKNIALNVFQINKKVTTSIVDIAIFQEEHLMESSENESSSAVTLATLPTDVIRRIIELAPGESMLNARLICKRWCVIVDAYRMDLPSIESAFFALQEDAFIFSFTINSADFAHFNAFLPLTCTKREQGTVTTLQFRIRLEGALAITLRHVFQRTSLIKHLKIEAFDHKALEIVRRSLMKVHIDELQVCKTEYFLKLTNSLTRMSKINCIDSIHVCDYDLDEIDSRDFIREISRSVSMIVIEFSRSERLSRDSKRFWKKIARELVKEKGLRWVFVMNGHEIVCDRRDRFLKFMQLFTD
ncbi:hypothetical protein PMAYCL1PPCAC_31983 [Pristionchus mayeri]|uniref:F-box domain-containing protein n=1 Tax=Pristionchus mayeri TaxID=1317129 RepID=A0AAN5DDZ5_9BILA|nr:hypothetical protein PMAYCL1PPCAC_31983 [Pristionchus mayeri]